MPRVDDRLAYERRRPVLLLILSLSALLLAGLSVAWLIDAFDGGSPLSGFSGRPGAAAVDRALPPVVAPQSDPAALVPLSTTDAEAANAAIPVSLRPNPAARSFLVAASGEAWQRSVACLTAGAYYEAAGEGVDGMRAVAQVILNRVRHPAFPHSVCGVVFQGYERSTGCQFSFTCDGSLGRIPSTGGWAQARAVAMAALQGSVYTGVGLATHYHTRWVFPYWASTLDKNAIVGNHIFYRWTQNWGQPAAFRAGYAGSEPELPWLTTLRDGLPQSVATPGTTDLSGTAGDPKIVLPTDRTMIGSSPTGFRDPSARDVAPRERWVIGIPPPAPARTPVVPASPDTDPARQDK